MKVNINDLSYHNTNVIISKKIYIILNIVTLTGKREPPGQRKKEKAQKEDHIDECNSNGDKESSDICENSQTGTTNSNKSMQTAVTCIDEDEIFTVSFSNYFYLLYVSINTKFNMILFVLLYQLTVSSNTSHNTQANSMEKVENIFFPSPRINPGLVVKNNTLYLYGGMLEVGDRQYTFNDFYSLGMKDLHFLKI